MSESSCCIDCSLAVGVRGCLPPPLGWLAAGSSCCYGPQASATDGPCVNQGLVVARAPAPSGGSAASASLAVWERPVELGAPNKTHFYGNPLAVVDGDLIIITVNICETVPSCNYTRNLQLPV